MFKQAQVKIDFGTGSVGDFNTEELVHYNRVRHYCPSDGYYSYASYTSNCFHGDWQTLTEDHTPGDEGGNMLLVNGAPSPGMFLKANINGLKGGTTYEFSMWIMNLCRITEKCGLVLLPNLTIRLQIPGGKVLAQFGTGDIPRIATPHWTQHRAMFTTPVAVTDLILTMVNNAPGGCGNDFAMDDINFRECVIPPPSIVSRPKPTTTKQAAVPNKKQTVAPKPSTTKSAQRPVTNEPKLSRATTPTIDSSRVPVVAAKQTPELFTPPPPVLTNRINALAKRIETTAGEIRVELYDNGQIDGDTVSIYHNNTLIKSKARLSDKPISFTIAVNAAEPYHELIMVANNLGSIPPNTSVMIITAGNTRHEVFISSTEQKNAKVVINLKNSADPQPQ
ncbi:MAG TPA: hypothetical protein VD993_19075 [Chitinophagaceae bacterium]|nr:hypothetical protein [Chitinophagaceae bacterium]